MSHRPSLFAVLACLTLSAPAPAQDLKPIKEWRGSVDDLALQSLAKAGVITTEKDLEALWKGWGIKEEMPKVDFTKQLVLVTTTRGSRLTLSPRLSPEGDLTISGIATRDLRPGFRWHMVTVSREGIKTVGGKPLPQ